MNPPITICLLTYRRTEYALRTIRAIRKNLKYDNLEWYIADAGSPPDHWKALWDEAGNWNRAGGHHPTNEGDVFTPSENWNLALQQILYEQKREFYLRLEDDFVLNQPLELERYVHLLQTWQDSGLVRFGLMPVGLKMESFGFEGDIFMRISKETQYCFSGHPYLAHRRFHDVYGLFPDAATPGECELAMDGKMRSMPGPDVWWPLKMGEWGVFGHIGEVKA